MRIWAVLVVIGSVGCSGCSGGETPGSPGEDLGASRDGGIWSPARGAGIEVLERGQPLPSSHLADVAELAPDAGPGPFTDMRVRVEVGGEIRTTPCVVPSGSYCDGFAVVDARGRTIAVDTYAYLGAKPACRSRWTAGARVTSLSGIWQQHASLSVLALAGCDGLDGAEGQAAGAPPSTDDVHQLLAGWAPGLGVSVRGVVVARWKSGSGAFGFALQDPGGAPASGVRVVRSRTSPVPASAPEVGDGVRVTARTSRSGEHVLEL
ncbi:MAG: hypothetical protein ACXWLA_00310 [Myxococcaceae bacterium]